MSTFSLKILASDKVFYDGRAEIVIIPVPDGEKAMMAHHEDMVLSVVLGELKFKKPDGTYEVAVIGNGFAQFINNRALILVDTAERPDEVDIARAREAEERAMEVLRQKVSIQQYNHSQASLARAMTRLKVTGKYNN